MGSRLWETAVVLLMEVFLRIQIETECADESRGKGHRL